MAAIQRLVPTAVDPFCRVRLKAGAHRPVSCYISTARTSLMFERKTWPIRRLGSIHQQVPTCRLHGPSKRRSGDTASALSGSDSSVNANPTRTTSGERSPQGSAPETVCPSSCSLAKARQFIACAPVRPSKCMPVLSGGDARDTKLNPEPRYARDHAALRIGPRRSRCLENGGTQDKAGHSSDGRRSSGSFRSLILNVRIPFMALISQPLRSSGG